MGQTHRLRHFCPPIPRNPARRAKHMEAVMAHIRIVDVPCGYGKSSRIVSSFDKREKYIAVVPYLSEVQRFIADARCHRAKA